MKDLDLFKEFAKVFESYGFKFYLVGGSVRDYLLGREFKEYDCCTDAAPDEISKIWPNGDYTFAKYGNVNFRYQGAKFEITTLRVEEGYHDFRHPSTIRFVSSTEDDYLRRDFTINALYMDKDEKLYDHCGGKLDLNNKIIRMIGNPTLRIIEDPLRILRAIRFCLLLNFKIEDELQQALYDEAYLLNELNPDKVQMEVKKILKIDNEKGKLLLNYLGVKVD